MVPKNTNSLVEISKRSAERWLNYPISKKEREKIEFLLNNEDKEDLVDCFHKKLEFGTGGMRGIIGIGSNRINKYTIGFATQGLSNYLIKYFRDDISVAIAYDSRKYSKDFAMHTAEILSSNKIKSYIKRIDFLILFIFFIQDLDKLLSI